MNTSAYRIHWQANQFESILFTRYDARVSPSDPNQVLVNFDLMGPPDRDIEWTEEGVRGASRFLNRLWILVLSQAERVASGPETFDAAVLDEDGRRLWRRYNRTVKKVTEDIEGRFNFNTAVSAIMELVNELTPYVDGGKGDDGLVRKVIEGLILILSPFVPFVCEEMWRWIGRSDAILDQSWPTFAADALEEEAVKKIQNHVIPSYSP